MFIEVWTYLSIFSIYNLCYIDWNGYTPPKSRYSVSDKSGYRNHRLNRLRIQAFSDTFLWIFQFLHVYPLLDGLNSTHLMWVSEMQASGFCLKCKTYGAIRNSKLIQMSNGRLRVAGSCSNLECEGRISKIVGWGIECFMWMHRFQKNPGSWSRGYDVALTWRRSQVQFLPSPPIG